MFNNPLIPPDTLSYCSRSNPCWACTLGENSQTTTQNAATPRALRRRVFTFYDRDTVYLESLCQTCNVRFGRRLLANRLGRNNTSNWRSGIQFATLGKSLLVPAELYTFALVFQLFSDRLDSLWYKFFNLMHSRFRSFWRSSIPRPWRKLIAHREFKPLQPES